MEEGAAEEGVPPRPVLAMVRCAGTARFMTSFEGSSLNIVLDEYVGSLI